ncbi:MAG: hypothetical protein QG624_835, partial [Pseudomonadota bacterium]|nr:hypothetical protein [Pseudomonadota bacterium]
KMKQLNVGEQVNLGQGYDFSARIEDACKKMSEAMRGFESARSVIFITIFSIFYIAQCMSL